MDDRYESSTKPDWRAWRRLFESRSGRALPPLDPKIEYAMLPRSLVHSLAVFQLGESGGGTIVEQARRSKLAGVDDDYAAAVELFVAEEHRHANILAMCVRLMRGELIRKNWTARLFVFARRLIGLRLKVLVLLAAEVVGICYYSSIADRLSPGPMQRWLQELVADERSHLGFHCDFLRSQTRTAFRRRLFIVAWRLVMCSAAVAVMVDHRHALRDMKIDPRVTWQRWMAIAAQAESFVTDRSGYSGVRTVPGDHQVENHEYAREGRNAEPDPRVHQGPVVVPARAACHQVANANLYPYDRNPAGACQDVKAEHEAEPGRIERYADFAHQPQARDELHDNRRGREEPVGGDDMLARIEHARLAVGQVSP